MYTVKAPENAQDCWRVLDKGGIQTLSTHGSERDAKEAIKLYNAADKRRAR